MPDLIIKPTNTSGNKVIIQDQAGGAVLTTADSGATLGNSTQDNITRLGTVATGNLANTAIVYPAGHVIQTTNTIYNSNDSSVTTSSTSARVNRSGALNWTGQITNVGASNHVLVTMGFCFNIDKDSVTTIGAGFSIWREATEIMIAKQHTHYLGVPTNGNWNYYSRNTIQFMDESPTTGTNNYYLGYRSNSSTNVTVRASSTYEPFRCILQEIKR